MRLFKQLLIFVDIEFFSFFEKNSFIVDFEVEIKLFNNLLVFSTKSNEKIIFDISHKYLSVWLSNIFSSSFLFEIINVNDSKSLKILETFLKSNFE